MKLRSHCKFGVITLLLLSIAVFGQTRPATFNYLITPDSAGDIRLGMTIAEARNVFKGAAFAQYDYSEEGVAVEVTRGEILIMTLMTDQEDKTGDEDGVVPIVETARIETVSFTDPRYKTADGVHIGMTVKEAEHRFGKLTKIELWEYDGSEHAEFSNSPKNYSFTVSPAKGSKESVTAGIYGIDEYTSTKYSPGAILESITISNRQNSETGYLITESSAGAIRIGMTVSEARVAMPDAVFKRSSDGEGIALIEVGNGDGDEAYMTLYAGEEDSESAINENAVIEHIEVWHSMFMTAEGVRPKMMVSGVENHFGKLKSIMRSEIESREFAEFVNSPKALSIRLSATNTDFAGVYENGVSETSKYVPESYVLSISLSGAPGNEN